MRRHNGKLFRVARAILRDDAEAEDALQDAYLEAYRHLDEFRGGARLSTWLTRIVINQALDALRASKAEPHRRAVSNARRETDAAEADVADDQSESPPGATLRAETRRALERRIDELPSRSARCLSCARSRTWPSTRRSECLAIPEATVRTRLFRARALLREALARDIDMATVDVFSFAGERCDRIVAEALERLEADPASPGRGPIRHDGLLGPGQALAPPGTPEAPSASSSAPRGVGGPR